MSFDEFCKLVANNGEYHYGESIKQQVTQLSFYDANDGQYVKFINKYADQIDIVFLLLIIVEIVMKQQ